MGSREKPLVVQAAAIVSDDSKAPGFGYRMSDRCRRDIEAIEANRRRAFALAHTVYFRSDIRETRNG